MTLIIATFLCAAVRWNQITMVPRIVVKYFTTKSECIISTRSQESAALLQHQLQKSFLSTAPGYCVKSTKGVGSVISDLAKPLIYPLTVPLWEQHLSWRFVDSLNLYENRASHEGSYTHWTSMRTEPLMKVRRLTEPLCDSTSHEDSLTHWTSMRTAPLMKVRRLTEPLWEQHLSWSFRWILFMILERRGKIVAVFNDGK